VDVSLAERLTEWLPILWFTAAVILVVLLVSSGTFDKLMQRVTKFGGFGVSFEFTEKGALETKESVQDGLAKIRTTLQRKIAADVYAASLQETFREVVQATSLSDKSKYRATIHIQDPLYVTQLFQLLDYYPRGRGAGRSFSARAGIIGLAWRTLSQQVWNQNGDVTTTDLVQLWGMTAKEAAERQVADTKKLFLAMPLRAPDTKAPIAVFYFDADDRPAVGLEPLPSLEGLTDVDADAIKDAADVEEKHLLATIAAEVTEQFDAKMAAQLTKFTEDLKKGSPLIDLETQ
jgi:hypothetical protein